MYMGKYLLGVMHLYIPQHHVQYAIVSCWASGIQLSLPSVYIMHIVLWWQAWDAWEAGQMEEVFDPKLYEGSQPREIKRCVEVGLLCLQSDRADRPTMADVLEMLHGKKRLPTLKKPAYMESESESEIESVTEGRSRNRWNRNRNRKSLRKAAHRRQMFLRCYMARNGCRP